MVSSQVSYLTLIYATSLYKSLENFAENLLKIRVWWDCDMGRQIFHLELHSCLRFVCPSIWISLLKALYIFNSGTVLCALYLLSLPSFHVIILRFKLSTALDLYLTNALYEMQMISYVPVIKLIFLRHVLSVNIFVRLILDILYIIWLRAMLSKFDLYVWLSCSFCSYSTRWYP